MVRLMGTAETVQCFTDRGGFAQIQLVPALFHSIFKIWLLPLSCCILFAQSLQADELKQGDVIPQFSAKDQFGKTFKFEAGTRFLLLGFDMSGSKLASKKLAKKGAGWLANHKAVFVLDIHTMPAIARFFALPKLKKYPERIVLVEDKKTLANFPRRSESITVLTLTPEGKIKDIQYWNPASNAVDQFVN